MTWFDHQHRSKKLAAAAQQSLQRGDDAAARDLYAQAAREAEHALAEVSPDKRVTLGTLAMSAASLWRRVHRAIRRRIKTNFLDPAVDDSRVLPCAQVRRFADLAGEEVAVGRQPSLLDPSRDHLPGRWRSRTARPVITPMLILIGSNDDWTPPKPCQEFANEGSNPKFVQMHVYPGATHSFDNASILTPQRVRGHRMVFDAEATSDARSRVIEFLRPLMQ
jgi:alpha-beta hydrolase superfamily lysophospholipase